jgi:hypothetical protein
MLLRIVLYTFRYCDFAKPLDCNTLIHTYSLITDVFYRNNM